MSYITPRPLPFSYLIWIVACTALFVGAAAFVLHGYRTGVGPAGGIFDQDSRFQKMKAAVVCANRRNDLYLIDGRYVLWVVEGDCSGTPDSLVCFRTNTITGETGKCKNDTFNDLLTTVSANLGQKDLGLSNHTVTRL